MIYLVYYIASGFLGFAAGRIGHIYGGHLKGPHHWIYGLVMVIPGIIEWQSMAFFLLMMFGIGVFVSDLKDFLEFKIYGADPPGEKRFWHIDWNVPRKRDFSFDKMQMMRFAFDKMQI